MPFNYKIVASNTWNLIYLVPLYLVKCKISHLENFLNNFFYICRLCLPLMLKNEYWLLHKTKMPFIPKHFVCVCVLPPLKSLVALGRFEEVSEKLGKNSWEEDIPLNTCDNPPPPPKKNKSMKQNYVKNWDNWGFPLLFI